MDCGFFFLLSKISIYKFSWGVHRNITRYTKCYTKMKNRFEQNIYRGCPIYKIDYLSTTVKICNGSYISTASINIKIKSKYINIQP